MNIVDYNKLEKKTKNIMHFISGSVKKANYIQTVCYYVLYFMFHKILLIIVILK